MNVQKKKSRQPVAADCLLTTVKLDVTLYRITLYQVCNGKTQREKYLTNL